MNSNVLFFSSKRDKIWIFLRILSEKNWKDKENMKKVSQLLSQKLEQVIFTHSVFPNISSIAELISKSNSLKGTLSPDETKALLGKIPKEQSKRKILKRYARGYVKKQ